MVPGDRVDHKSKSADLARDPRSAPSGLRAPPLVDWLSSYRPVVPVSYNPVLLMQNQDLNWCRGTESDCPHLVFQTSALTAELPRHIKLKTKNEKVKRKSDIQNAKFIQGNNSKLTLKIQFPVYFGGRYRIPNL